MVRGGCGPGQRRGRVAVGAGGQVGVVRAVGDVLVTPSQGEREDDADLQHADDGQRPERRVAGAAARR